MYIYIQHTFSLHCIYIHIILHIHIQTIANIYIFIFIFTYTHMYILNLHVHIHIDFHIHKYIHTNIQTHITQTYPNLTSQCYSLLLCPLYFIYHPCHFFFFCHTFFLNTKTQTMTEMFFSFSVMLFIMCVPVTEPHCSLPGSGCSDCSSR